MSRLMTEEVELLNIAVDDFTIEMKAKLKEKVYQGYSDWDDPTFEKVIIEKLIRNGIQQDWIDVANLAMFLHWFQKVK